MVFGPLEFGIALIIVLMWVVPFGIVVILVRNYLRKRQTAQSRELQDEIELLKKQVEALEQGKVKQPK